jgi:hypothetical protein
MVAMVLEQCDLTNASSVAFTVPAGSQLSGWYFASPTCPAANVSTLGDTIAFGTYDLP